MLVPQFLFGLGPLEFALIFAIVILLHGVPIIMQLRQRVGEVVGATDGVARSSRPGARPSRAVAQWC